MPAGVSEILRTIGYRPPAPADRVGEIPLTALANIIGSSKSILASYPDPSARRLLIEQLAEMPVQHQLKFLSDIGADDNEVLDIISAAQKYSRPSGGSGFMPGEGPDYNPRGY